MYRTSSSHAGLLLPWLVSGLLAVGTGPALAQLVPNAGQLLNELQRSERELPTRPQATDLIQENAPRAAIKLPEGAQVDVARFRITGSTSFDASYLAAMVKPWEGRVLDVNGLNEAAGAITRYYQNQGFLLAYAYLPVQKIEQGVIEIAVLEGRVDSVQIVSAQDVRLNDEVIQNFVAGIAQAPQVQQADLERRLLLLNDIPGVVARASFAPGSRSGTADVIVTVAEEEPLSYGVDFNNQGSKSTGEYRFGAQFQFKNLFGVGDSTRLHLQSSTRTELVNGGLTTRIPLGGAGWSLDAGVSRLTYELGAPYTSLGARGEANTLHLGLGYQLTRSLEENVSFTGGVDYKDLTDVLENISTNKKHSQQFSLGMLATSRDQFMGGGTLQSTITLTAGTLDWDTANTAQSPSGSFSKLNFDGSRRQQLAENWSLSLRANGQYTSDSLDSSEKFSLTGPYAVRAYAPGQASVDFGSVIAIELRKLWPLTGGTLSGNVFFDYAHGVFDANPVAGTNNDITLRGYGLGIDWATGADLDVSLTAAWRSSQILSTDSDREPYIYLQINKSF